MSRFADDTAIISSDPDPVRATERLQHHLNLLQNWLERWGIEVNPTKSAQVTFTTRRDICPPVNLHNTHIHSFISIHPSMQGLEGTSSGTLHPGQVFGGSLSLLSPAFRCSHLSRQVPPSATTREILAAKGGTVGEKDVR